MYHSGHTYRDKNKINVKVPLLRKRILGIHIIRPSLIKYAVAFNKGHVQGQRS